MFALLLRNMFRAERERTGSSLTENEFRWIREYVLYHLRRGEIEKAMIQLRIAERRISLISRDKDSEDDD
jgi:hypothetical protein